MKKRIFVLAACLVAGVQSVQAGTMGESPADCWSGFYAGADAAYLQSVRNSFQTTVDQISWNSFYFPNALVVSRTLSDAGSHLFAIKQTGAGWGGQLGYQRVTDHNLLWGAEAQLLFAAGMATTETYTNNQYFGASGLNYRSIIEETKDIDYLASLRGRVGYLMQPKVLVYATGGLALGKATLTSSARIMNTGAPNVFPAHTNLSRTSSNKAGWTAGAGAEWNFMNNLSARLEYKYYDLGTLSNRTLADYLVNLPALDSYASGYVNSRARFAYNSIELGLNYHFC